MCDVRGAVCVALPEVSAAHSSRATNSCRFKRRNARPKYLERAIWLRLGLLAYVAGLDTKLTVTEASERLPSLSVACAEKT